MSDTYMIKENNLRLHCHFKYDFANRVADRWNVLASWIVKVNNINILTKQKTISNIRILYDFMIFALKAKEH